MIILKQIFLKGGDLMSITAETAKAHAKDPAVTCCRFEVGTVIDVANLEDPAIFPDLVDSGLLEITSECLTIEQVLGATITKTIDSLTPITADMVDGVKESKKEEVSYLGNQFLILVKKKENASVIFEKWWKERAILKISEIALPMMKKFEKNHHIPSKINFQEMPTRWGSCTVKNKLIFNPRLIHVPKRCIEYVIMHELCHLIHKHHNKDFFELLTLKMPDWEKRKEKLDKYRQSKEI